MPVVVKPRDGNQGRGVATNLTTREQIVAAYQAALVESKEVVVEKFAPGHDYRLLVVGGKVVAAARREPAQVLGDGMRTIRELVNAANLDPRRGEHHATVLSKIKLDAVALGVLSDQGYTADSVPPAGTVVLIRRNGNLSTFLRTAPENILLKYKNGSSLSAKVRRRLRQVLPGDVPDFDQLAEELNITPATLRRRLSEEGASFQGIKDELRRDLAISYLSDSNRSVMDIALELGFSERSAFHRAFRKWTGASPGAFRRELQS